jgi:hypothetical protein
MPRECCKALPGMVSRHTCKWDAPLKHGLLAAPRNQMKL